MKLVILAPMILMLLFILLMTLIGMYDEHVQMEMGIKNGLEQCTIERNGLVYKAWQRECKEK